MLVSEHRFVMPKKAKNRLDMIFMRFFVIFILPFPFFSPNGPFLKLRCPAGFYIIILPGIEGENLQIGLFIATTYCYMELNDENTGKIP